MIRNVEEIKMMKSTVSKIRKFFQGMGIALRLLVLAADAV